MQRRTSQTFQRLRKLSDSIVSAIVPQSSFKPTEKDSFFEYGKKGWHPRIASASSTSLPLQAITTTHRHPSYRNGQRVSKEDIMYPLIRTTDPLDPENSTDSNGRLRARARRPERPREEDLPYGAQGSIPKAMAPPYIAPPPAIGSGPLQVVKASQSPSSVPFPNSAHVAGGERQQMARHEKPLPELPQDPRAQSKTAEQQTFFNPFMSASVPLNNNAARAPAAGSSAHARADRVPDASRTHRTAQHHRPDRAQAPAHTPTRESSSQPYIRVRRISSTGDLHPAPHHVRYRDENAAPSSSHVRPARSTPLRVQEKEDTRHAPLLRPQPTRAAQPLTPLAHVTKPRPRNVPRDVDAENPQGLPTPRQSSEEVRPQVQPQQERHDLHQAPPLGPVATKAQAELRVQQSAAPKPVRVDGAAPEHLRAISFRAQIVRPTRDAERERERKRDVQRQPERSERAQGKERERSVRGRERQRRPTYTRAVEIEYYGMSDAFAQEITIALAEPERALPLPLDWRIGSGGAGAGQGYDYGVRPLVTKKNGQMQRMGAAAR
ncbi:hypothetical protein BC628DRAFT_1059254 [Trametes gibbosa]|nr:hypothetical protein BC628DRAFT_1059254 [Trametes gibbosa]